MPRDYIYLVSFSGPKSKRWKYLKLRETNFKRARHTLITLLKKNKKWMRGRIEKSSLDGMEQQTVYTTMIKGTPDGNYLQKI